MATLRGESAFVPLDREAVMAWAEATFMPPRNLQISDTAPALSEINPGPASLLESAHTKASPLGDEDSTMSVPILDLAGLRAADKEARARILKELRAATEAWGFFLVVNHSVTDELQDMVHRQAQEFFTLPLDVKKLAQFEGPNARSLGYMYMADSPKSSSSQEQVVRKESLADSVEATRSLEDLSSKIWPTGKSTFNNVLGEYLLAVEGLGYQLLELLAESLGVETDFYSRRLKNPGERFGTWRLHNVPGSLGFISSQHTDPNVITLVEQDVEGLQVRKRGVSTWTDVKLVPGSFSVNVGDTFEAWSNGIFPSVEHRVLLKSGTRRLSKCVFIAAWPSVHIEAPPQLIDDAHPSQFTPFLASELRESFEDRTGQVKLDETKKVKFEDTSGIIITGVGLDCFRRKLV